MVGLSASLGVKSNLKQFQIFLGFFSEKWSKLQCFRFNQLRIFFECIFLKDFLKSPFFFFVSLDYFCQTSKVMLPDSFPWVVYVLVAASMAWSCYQRAMLYAKSWDQWHPWVVCSSSLVGWAWLGMPNRIDGNERFSWSQSAGNMEKRKLSTCVR